MIKLYEDRRWRATVIHVRGHDVSSRQYATMGGMRIKMRIEDGYRIVSVAFCVSVSRYSITLDYPRVTRVTGRKEGREGGMGYRMRCHSEHVIIWDSSCSNE